MSHDKKHFISLLILSIVIALAQTSCASVDPFVEMPAAKTPNIQWPAAVGEANTLRHELLEKRMSLYRTGQILTGGVVGAAIGGTAAAFYGVSMDVIGGLGIGAGTLTALDRYFGIDENNAIYATAFVSLRCAQDAIAPTANANITGAKYGSLLDVVASSLAPISKAVGSPPPAALNALQKIQGLGANFSFSGLKSFEKSTALDLSATNLRMAVLYLNAEGKITQLKTDAAGKFSDFVKEVRVVVNTKITEKRPTASELQSLFEASIANAVSDANESLKKFKEAIGQEMSGAAKMQTTTLAFQNNQKVAGSADLPDFFAFTFNVLQEASDVQAALEQATASNEQLKACINKIGEAST